MGTLYDHRYCLHEQFMRQIIHSASTVGQASYLKPHAYRCQAHHGHVMQTWTLSDLPTIPPEMPPIPVTPEPTAPPIPPLPSENPVPVREPTEVNPPVAARRRRAAPFTPRKARFCQCDAPLICVAVRWRTTASCPPKPFPFDHEKFVWELCDTSLNRSPEKRDRIERIRSQATSPNA